MKLVFALFCLIAGHLLAWLQLNGPIFSDWWKDNIWISALCVSPMIFFFSMSYWSITYEWLQAVWSVKFIQVDNLNRHPSQIYEALMEGLVLFIILNYIMKSYHKREGLISGFFLIYYSMFRFFIEFTREPDQHIGFIFSQFTFGQIISFVSLIFDMI